MDTRSRLQLERGVFTFSLDFELLWGTLETLGPDTLRRQCQFEREAVIDRLLTLFTEFEIPATWCIVGHLFLENCERPASLSPQARWHRRADFAKHESAGCVFCGRGLIEKIRACLVPQEIGCHTFTHPVFSEEHCSRAAAKDEIEACVQVAEEMGITLRSFVFPRNQVGHLELLRDYGFLSFRGPEPHEAHGLPNWRDRLAHLWAVCTASQPFVYEPELTASGLWNIPGSMIYFPMHGRRRYLPLFLRVRRAMKGLQAAVKQKKVFHLWAHPTNFADEPEQMFAGLRTIIAHAAQLRERGQLDIQPMGALVPEIGSQNSAVGIQQSEVRGSLSRDTGLPTTDFGLPTTT